MPRTSPFRPALFQFVRDLAANNRREWFQANKARYEDDVKDPALTFISDFGPHLAKISPHFLAIPKAQGGSLFRIYRDTRFGKDKTPYKTHVGIQFRHEQAKDAHAPGFYLHLEPRGSFVGAGLWHPDGPALKAIRRAIDTDRAGWKRARNAKAFASRFELAGDSLKTAPRDYDPEHPLIEDLRRKDFIGVTRISQKTVTAPGFVAEFAAICRDAVPLVRFLCRAADVPF